VYYQHQRFAIESVSRSRNFARILFTGILYIRMISAMISLTRTRKSSSFALQETEQRKRTPHAHSENMHLVTIHYERWKNDSLSTEHNHNSRSTETRVISVLKLY